MSHASVFVVAVAVHPKRALTAFGLGVTVLAAPLAALAAYGDPCDMTSDCQAGWACVPDADGVGYCTTVCPAEGCPDGFSCRSGGAEFEFCLKGEGLPPGGALGTECQGPDACEEPLICAEDNGARYCTRYCTVPGSCPTGYRCNQAGSRICQKLVAAPATHEPCAEGMCAAGFGCVSHPNRTLPFCAWPCPAGACDPGMACVEGHCLPDPMPLQPGFGEPCVADGAEARVVGCKDGAFCLLSGPDSYCTRTCDIDHLCPDGYGCKRLDADRAECRRGVPSDDYFVPMAYPDYAMPDPPGSAPPPMQAVEQEGGSDGEKSSGCQATLEGGPALRPMAALVAGLALVWLALRRRRPGA